MSNHVSAEKRARQTVRRTARNTARLNRVRKAIRVFRKALTGDDKSLLEQAWQAATRELQKAASKGIIHKRNVARKVSRLAQAHNKANSASA